MNCCDSSINLSLCFKSLSMKIIRFLLSFCSFCFSELLYVQCSRYTANQIITASINISTISESHSIKISTLHWIILVFILFNSKMIRRWENHLNLVPENYLKRFTNYTILLSIGQAVVDWLTLILVSSLVCNLRDYFWGITQLRYANLGYKEKKSRFKK